MILDGNLVAKNIDNYTKSKILEKPEYYENKYVVFLLFEDNDSSRVYIKMKQKKAESFGIGTKVIEDINLKDFKEAIQVIEQFNQDKDCIGILVQLPLNEYLRPYQGQILSRINPRKDIDGLGGVLFGLHQIQALYFLPATVRAIFEILKFYKIPVGGQKISILGQSNLIGKPTALECISQQGTIFSFNEFSDLILLKHITQESDIIISATGKLHLIDSTYLNPNKMQVLIDVGWGKLNGKPTGDFNFDEIFSKYKEENFMYTPVPGGVGPVTVSSIFANMVDLLEIF